MKTVDEIYEGMKAAYAAKTGLVMNDGGDMALRLYAVASQICCLWVQADFVGRQTFPQTAEGEYLDRHAGIRGLERGPAAFAAGKLRFTVSAAGEKAVSVPSGTACMTAAGVEFVTTAAAEIAAGSLFCDAPAQAVLAGAAGSVPAESVVYMEHAPQGVEGVYNPSAFSGGADAENDESLRERVLASYRKLPNGANAAYYEEQTLAVPGVAAVSVIPKRRGVGTVDIIITDATGPAGAELISAVREKLSAQREICVSISVLAPAAVSVDVTASVTAESGCDAEAVRAAVSSAVAAYFTGERLGEDVLRAKLGSIIYGVAGVKNYSLLSPSADVSVGADELPVLGGLAITAV